MREIIRNAKPEDAFALHAIYEPYILNTAITFETQTISVEDFQERMGRIQSKYPWLVYEEEGKILGYAYASIYRERAAYAWDCECSVYVAEEVHKKGIATKLYTELFERLEAQGYYNIYAFITYPHESSVRLHKKFGFREVGIFHKTGYKLGKWWDLIVMEKALKEHEERPVAPAMPK